MCIVPGPYSTCSYTKMTIFLDSKSWNVNMVSYRPASLYLCTFPENANQSKNIERTGLLMDLLTKIIFSNVILPPDFKIFTDAI